MKKIIFLISLILAAFISIGQPVVNRSGPANTVSDARWKAQYNLVVPVYPDTATANLTVNIGIDSCYAVIATRDSNYLWYRQCSPKKWVKLGSGGSSAGGVNIYNSDGSLTADRQLDGAGYYLRFNDLNEFGVGADSVSINVTGGIGFLLNDTGRFTKRVSYTSNIGSTFTRHTLVDKNYVDSLVTNGSVNIYNSNGSLTSNRTLNQNGYNLTFRGDSIVINNSGNEQKIRLVPGLAGVEGSKMWMTNPDGASMVIQTGDEYLETLSGWYIRNQLQYGNAGLSVNTYTGQYAPVIEALHNAETIFYLGVDSFSMKPPSGKLNIDSLRTLAAGDDEMMTWNPRTGVVSHQAIPSGNSSGSSNGTVTPEQSSSVVYNSGSYNAFNSIAWDRSNPDTIVNTWKNSGNHAADGYIMWNYTTDGFASFTTADTLRVDGSNLSASVIMVGKGNGGRWVYSYGVNGDYDTIYFAKSDAISNEVTSAGIIRAATSGVGYDWLFPFGKTIKMNGDTLYMPGYGLRTGQTQTEAVYFKTYDNGNTWSFGGVIVANATFGSSTPSETDWEIYEQGATVATTKIVAIVRDDFYKARHLQMISTDGGATWTNLFLTQGDFAFHDVNSGAIVAESWPCMILKEGQYLYAVHGIRNTLANGGFSFRVFKTKDPTSINTWEGGVTTPKFSTSYRALGFYKNDPIDWGYGWPYITPNKRLRTIFYDVAAKWTTNGSVPENVEIKTISLLGNNTYEAYNDADQSISTGTETTVLFPDPWLDSENFYNSDSTKIFIPSDGYYEINAFVQIDTSALGTYRKFQLKALDGAIYGGAGTSIYATYLLDKAIIQPSTNSEFNYVHLKSGKELKAGMWVVVTVTQDAGISLNIKNTVVNAGSDGARIILKKIN